ncbi:MAG: BON domain-containing protein [Chloroflexota bacterium]|nr:BON domain-containing protein [Chloroflexota bacterium]
MSTPDDRTVFLAQLDGTLESADLAIATRIDGDVLFLAGEVDSEENHQAALDVATAMAGPAGLTIDDSIEVFGDDSIAGLSATPREESGDFAYQDPDTTAYEGLEGDVAGTGPETVDLEADFTDDIGTVDAQVSAAEAIPYMPPTDPVVGFDPAPGGDGRLEVIGGFSATSTDDSTATGGITVPADDDLSAAVLRELREDALTTDLMIQADTRDGVVTIRGTVQTLDDAENVEAVARGVEGVVDVNEELTVLAITHARP